MAQAPLVAKHRFILGDSCGGEELSLETEIFWNEDDPKDGPCTFTNQKITLQSYSNSASLNLFGTSITPETLRELANQLDKARIEAQSKVEELFKERQRKSCAA